MQSLCIGNKGNNSNQEFKTVKANGITKAMNGTKVMKKIKTTMIAVGPIYAYVISAGYVIIIPKYLYPLNLTSYPV